MPFTFAHPAIVLPIQLASKQRLSLTGLVIGSLVPDFEYFIRMRMQSDYSHTIAGIFWFDLPLALLLAFVFHAIVRNSLISNLPLFFKSRLLAFSRFNWLAYFKANWWLVILSVLIGIATHLLWDSFTHPAGYFVGKISALSSTISLWGKQIPVFKLAQHGSSVLGLLVLAITLFKLPQTKKVNPVISLRYWAVLCGVMAIIAIIRFVCGFNRNIDGNLIVMLISASLIALVVTPLLIWRNNNMFGKG